MKNGKICEKITKTDGLNISIIFNNISYTESLETDWGFSCLITGTEKTVLFDTGANPDILLGNMEKMKIDPQSIESVVISHDHNDHAGGLAGLLKLNPHVQVNMLAAFRTKLKESIRPLGRDFVELDSPAEICPGICTTGPLGGWRKEQAIMINTDAGLIVITGCAHPDIVEILETARDMAQRPILLAMGGFHLEWCTKGKITRIIEQFQQLGVKYVSCSHCTGPRAIGLFGQAYAENFIASGAGKVIDVRNLT